MQNEDKSKKTTLDFKNTEDQIYLSKNQHIIHLINKSIEVTYSLN